MNNSRFVFVLAAAFGLSACGGGSQKSQVGLSGAESYEQLIEQFLTAAPPEAIALPEAIDASGSLAEPNIRTLQWPTDFPAELQAGLTQTVMVRGLAAREAYDFDISLPDHISSDDATLFAMNIDSDSQTSGPVCYGDPDCTGTVTADLVSLQLVSFVAGTATVSIAQSSSPALLDEGSEADPYVLDLSAGQYVHAGTIGATQATQNQLRTGQSFYRLRGLSIGDRYTISLSDASDDDVALFFNESRAQCDPAYSGEHRCVLVADAAELDFTASGEFVLFGVSFNLAVEKVSDRSRFEGNWNAPMALPSPDASTVHHLGRADRFSSYYKLDGLDSSRRYRLLLSGMTAAARLKLNSPQTSLPVFAPQCSLLHEDAQSGEQVCIIENSSSVYFRVESVSAESSYMVSILPGPANTGDAASPEELRYESGLLYRGQVGAQSVYSVSGLTPSEQYLFQLNAPTSFPEFALSLDSGMPIDCDSGGLTHCVFTATDAQISLVVRDNGSEIGERFVLSLLPIDPSSGNRPTPYPQVLTLTDAELPHRGTVDDFYSQYTISGLLANHPYLASIDNPSESMSFAVWPNTESGIDCNITDTGFDTTACLARAGTDGKLRIRIGGDAGGHFRLAVSDATTLDSDYYSLDTPVSIVDNSPIPASSSILVSDDRSVGFLEVMLQIEHRYSSDLLIRLEAPDGRMITLADHVPGTTFAQTRFSDIAERANPRDENNHSHARKAYRPAQPLHVLNHITRAGEWRLHVADDTYSNRSDALGGTLLGWGISFVDPHQSANP